MQGEALSLVAALVTAAHILWIRKGMFQVSPRAAVLMVAGFTVLVFGLLSAGLLAAGRMPGLNWKGLLFFAGAGILEMTFARNLFYASIERIGASRGSQVKTSAVVITAGFSILFLGESPSAFDLLGMGFIVIGAVLLAGESAGNPTPVNPPAGSGQSGVSLPGGEAGDASLSWKRRRLAGWIYGSLAAVFFAGSNVVRGAGLDHIPSPILAVFFGALVGAIPMLPWWREIRNLDRGGWQSFALGSTASAASQGLAFSGYMLAGVAVATALYNTAPLFTVLLAYMFFKKYERITLRLALIGLLITTGVAFMSLG
ncbi:MAG: DMT family transporter [Firmicutes bacterium]|nr:DMT family transporter [Bacillota bacterium]